ELVRVLGGEFLRASLHLFEEFVGERLHYQPDLGLLRRHRRVDPAREHRGRARCARDDELTAGHPSARHDPNHFSASLGHLLPPSFTRPAAPRRGLALMNPGRENITRLPADGSRPACARLYRTEPDPRAVLRLPCAFSSRYSTIVSLAIISRVA